MTHRLIRWALPWLVAACMQGRTPLYAQDVSPVGALAYTTCLGGHVKTFVDAAIIGTDSLTEILVHEAKHREQAARSAPMCQRYTPWTLLASEVEAYCASRPFRMARGWSELEVDINYLTRLFSQFKGAMPRRDIVRAYRTGCPAKGAFQIMEIGA